MTMDRIAVLWPSRLRGDELPGMEGIVVYERVGVLNAASIAQNLVSEGFDAVIGTTGIAQEIRRVTSLPTHILAAAYVDILESFAQIERERRVTGKKFALLLHRNNPLDISRITPYLHNSVELVLFETPEDVRRALENMRGNKYEVILTGPTGMFYAREMGLPAYFIRYSRATLEAAVTQVQFILQLARKEVLQLKRLQTAIDISPDGIVATDGQGHVNLCNIKAAELLNLSYEQIMGKPIVTLTGDPSWRKVYHDGKEQRDVLMNLKQDSYFSSRRPITQNGEVVGSVGTLQEVEKIRKMEHDYRSLQTRGLVARSHFSDITGRSVIMRQLVQQAELYAKTDMTVLLEGETGTGKEVFAQSIHNASARRQGPFVAINCAALSESLLESELMGYEEGSFTGAKKGGKAGLFELAHEGTIFLDEINQFPLHLQGKLLRVLQEKTVLRVGGERVIPVDVRVVVATNEDLREKIKKGLFRQDLYYRINILQLCIPPLRERREDIIDLIAYFLSEAASGECALTPDELYAALPSAYGWPGNIRELQNYVWRSVALGCCAQAVDPNMLSAPVSPETGGAPDALSVSIAPMDEMVRQIVKQVVADCGGNKSKAAARLGISRNTLNQKMGNKEA